MIYLSGTLTHIIDQPVSVIRLNLSCPRYKRSKEGGRTLAVRATNEWNKLSVGLKRSTIVKIFKRPVFKIILNSQILTQLFM